MEKRKNKAALRDASYPNCPIRNVLARIGDKWSMLVLYTLNGGGTMRFSELLRALPDISQKMLTVTLRTLEEDGFVSRTVYPEVPPRVEYALTERARSMLPYVDALLGWAQANMEAILADRERKRGKTAPTCGR